MSKSKTGDKSFISNVKKREIFIELEKTSNVSERLKDLQAIAKEREEDVAYTLEIHAELLKQEENMKKFILEEYRKRKMEEELKNTQKPKKISKETLERLYNPHGTKSKEVERPQSAQPLKSAASTQQFSNKGYDDGFVKKLIDYHAKVRPQDQKLITAESLFNFWKDLNNKV